MSCELTAHVFRVSGLLQVHFASSGHKTKKESKYIDEDCAMQREASRYHSKSADHCIAVRRNLLCTLFRRAHNRHFGRINVLKFVGCHL